MNPLLTLAAAAAITVFHIWASRRRPRYWYLGGIVPTLWIGAVVFLLANGMIRLAEDWKMLPPFSCSSGWRAIRPPRKKSWSA